MAQLESVLQAGVGFAVFFKIAPTLAQLSIFFVTISLCLPSQTRTKPRAIITTGSKNPDICQSFNLAPESDTNPFWDALFGTVFEN